MDSSTIRCVAKAPSFVAKNRGRKVKNQEGGFPYKNVFGENLADKKIKVDRLEVELIKKRLADMEAIVIKSGRSLITQVLAVTLGLNCMIATPNFAVGELNLNYVPAVAPRPNWKTIIPNSTVDEPNPNYLLARPNLGQLMPNSVIKRLPSQPPGSTLTLTSCISWMQSTLFISSILNERPPYKLHLSTLEKYDETTDPLDNLQGFTTSMLMLGPSEVVLYLAFLVTLKGVARTWFAGLKPN